MHIYHFLKVKVGSQRAGASDPCGGSSVQALPRRNMI